MKIIVNGMTYELDADGIKEVLELIEKKAVTKYQNKAIIPAENKDVQ